MQLVKPRQYCKMNIGDIVRDILMRSQLDNRLVCGLENTSMFLKESENSEQSLFFFIAPLVTFDSVKHMQEVFLQAFCFENDIYIIKLDSAEKLNIILGNEQGDATCALVFVKMRNDKKKKEKYTESEKVLIDHCENFWDEPIQPIITLPVEV